MASAPSISSQSESDDLSSKIVTNGSEVLYGINLRNVTPALGFPYVK